ncbi:MAG TPA: DDE-type integrase/transposase/recombinase, partial [Pyrinomonadaceae bacterium]
GRTCKYLYRAVDKEGNTIEFILSAKRDVSVAKRFFKKPMRAEHRRLPFSISVDKNAAYPEVFSTSYENSSADTSARGRTRRVSRNLLQARVGAEKGTGEPVRVAGRPVRVGGVDAEKRRGLRHLARTRRRLPRQGGERQGRGGVRPEAGRVRPPVQGLQRGRGPEAARGAAGRVHLHRGQVRQPLTTRLLRRLRQVGAARRDGVRPPLPG